MAVFATPQMLSVLSETLFVQADVTYPGTHTFPYLLNIVAYNHATLGFQAVARVIISKLNAVAYAEAFHQVLAITTNFYPAFDNGKVLKAWVDDFSDAQSKGLAKNIGSAASSKIRGCSVHFMRNVEKVLVKVCVDEQATNLFRRIAFTIPKLEDEDHIALAFSILTGSSPLAQAGQFMQITPKELSVNTKNWTKARDWVKWWSRGKILTMFTKCYKDMTTADWENCPTTTNAVESQNKLTKIKSSCLTSNLRAIYLEDKKKAFQTLAAVKLGVKIGDNNPTKKRKQKLRIQRRNDRRVKQKSDTFELNDKNLSGDNSSCEEDRESYSYMNEESDDQEESQMDDESNDQRESQMEDKLLLKAKPRKKFSAMEKVKYYLTNN